jgi:EAL domain-containing protein (putative c-di-GMP-specific phosphodiesterase class I)
VRLGDVARIEFAPEEVRRVFRGNGVDQVGIGIVRQSRSNALDVGRLVKEKAEEITRNLPPGTQLVVAYDSTIFIDAAIERVWHTLAEATVLVVLVIFLFLGSWRAAFIPAAERYGLMGAIDRWVIQTAFREYANGISQTGAQIAINLSGNSLSDESLLGFIEAQFAEHAFSPERVCFEITETAAIQNLRHAVELMATLKRHGSQLALDDFGSGLSSFHYLKTLPIDYLKIDGSFVKDMIENANDCALVAAINQMSHTIGIQTVAEYAHSQAIIERLRELGVDYAQGYYFGRPALPE